ncbi:MULTISPECIES: prolyl oligopeptidase family serine peptidase [Streptomyces]|uniref:Dipeptidyl aminopeptidase/acylaminoacyl peptidase n=2 Tax=Streptomyces TaxID=1883 RepID=A0ABT9LNP4_STRGD|nr:MULTISPECIES: prolyl oligopeptidase family serine peptidase [Streptomyces]MDP9685156.1 dipeptidyl aminopeptidase/acylaminoacyl peptidase [Streptomyces griseoviridis]GGS95103.1 acyl-peptide hydrolase [Streptomyces griseoviridis]GGU32437.1 acyl-peptide hydrolase [Streptomyces daghestanicus]GHI32056.1 acyl-peptide hydrolase [Streptomyces daghestanicus]
MGETVRTLAYGAWPSPIDAALAAAHDGRPDDVAFVGDEVWWTAPRPAEGGRRTLVRRRADGGEEALLPAPWNVRSRVIEYGGRPWAATVDGDGPLVVFVHFADQRLYRWRPGGEPVPLTPVSAVGGGLRWAEPQPLPARGEVWCVLEEFTGGGPTDVRRVLAAVPLDGSAAGDRGAVRELTGERHRFVTGPRLAPDGRRAAWLAWDHPRMPWDGTELLVAEVGDDGVFGPPRTVAGGPEESIAQADWDRDGRLLHVSDRTGWWNLYRDGRPLCPREEEFGGPLWKLGLRWFAPLDNGLVAVVHGRGAGALGVLDPETGEVVDAAGPWTEFAAGIAAYGERIAAVGASPRSAHEVVELDTRTGRARVIGAAHDDAVDPAYYPEPQIRTFTGPDGRDIHAHVYPPHHPDCAAPAGELPPYVIRAHGGPTSRSPLVLDLEIAYFTSRGIGVAEVDYGGSTGHGRAYRERLRGQWGVVDVEDCAAVALALADEGTADRARLAVRGGSAGGWTAAASLAGTDVYACGTVLYPVLDLTGWGAGETHDFESRYLDSLIGPYDEVPARYAERSPAEHADRITAPFLLLQGLDDVICPPAQCERFLARMAGRRVPHAYLAFEGEGHGFRRAETMVRALEAELSLYAQVFGLDTPGVPTLELTE